MRTLFPVLAKRLLSFALALVLLLSLCPVLPLTADAAIDAEGWGFDSTLKQYFSTAQFISSDDDLVFEEGQDYDWYLMLAHSNGKAIKLSIEATIKDSSGNTVGTYSKPASTLQPTTLYPICYSTDFTDFDKDLAGTFTLDVAFYYNTTKAAWLTKEFTRVAAPDNNAAFTPSSRSNPDMIFTYADPIDLELNIVKTNGVAEGFNAVTTITNASSEVVSSGTYTIPSSANTDVSVKDLVDVTNIRTPGNYNVNVTLNDASGNKRYETTIPFAVVAMDRTVSVSITGNDTFEDTTPTLSVYLKKDDGVTENCSVQITVIDTETGNTVYSDTVEGAVSGTESTRIQPTLSSLPVVGSFRMDVVVKDNEGITRGTASKTFTRTNSTPLSASLTDNITGNEKAGMIYSDSDNPLVLTINHPSSANKTLTIRYTGTYNGEALDDTRDIIMPASGSITLDAKDFVKYGIYENLHISIYDAAGTMRWEADSTYSFSLVVDSSESESIPLLNINDHFTNSKINGDYTVKLPLAAQTGANMWRCTIPWSTVEKTAGTFNFSPVDSVMIKTQTLGMKALIILAYENDIYGDPDPTSTTWKNAYANYCYETAKYMADNYPDVVVGFEIWNEWNHATMSKVPDGLREGDLYAQVVIAASEKIRAVNTAKNTSFKVVGGATAGDGYIPGTNTDEFLDEMLPVDGIMEAMDAFSFHTYPNPEMGTSRGDNPRYFEFVSPAEFSYANRIKSVKERLIANGASEDMEIWLTETGWSTIVEQRETGSDGATHITTGVTEAEAAAYMVQMYAWALADGTLDRIFWYDLMNDQKDPDGDNTYDWYDDMSECNWGLIHCCSNTDGEPLAYSAKQGYVAMCAIGSMLNGATNGKSINLGTGVHAYQFEKDGHYLMVAWTDDDADTTRTATFSGSIDITDMFGNATTYNGTATLELSESPIYIEYSKSSIPTIG